MGGVATGGTVTAPTGGSGQPTGGTTTTGGSPAGGSPPTGGAPPSGGTTASGGTAGTGTGGTGTAGTGTGGTGTGGTAGTAGTGTAGTAGTGTAGTGTAGTAGTGTGGTAGTGTAGTAGTGTAGTGTAGTGPIGDDDTCQMGVYDPANPPQRLNSTGDLGTHDPTMLEDGGTFYRFQTGMGAHTAPSITGPWAGGWGTNALTRSPTFDSIGTVNGPWAPDIVKIGDQYHLYYSGSSFGSNNSCIGHSSRTTMADTGWEPGDTTICSSGGDNYNAIDPDVLVAPDGTPWMVFGSFWSGANLIQLDADGKRVGTEVETLATGRRGDGEGAFLAYRCGYYYLFFSHGLCCPGAEGRSLNDLTYNIVVGRSESIHGPYVDKEGTPMLEGGGTVIVEGDGGATAYAAGHGEWIRQGDKAYIMYHAYTGPGNGAEFRVADLVWDEEGWPVPVGP